MFWHFTFIKNNFPNWILALKKHTRSYMDFLKEYVEDSFKGFNAFPHLKTSIFPHLARTCWRGEKMLRNNLCAKYFFPFIFNAILWRNFSSLEALLWSEVTVVVVVEGNRFSLSNRPFFHIFGLEWKLTTRRRAAHSQK